MIVTRDQALCLFYCVEYNEANVIKLTKKLDKQFSNELSSQKLKCNLQQLSSLAQIIDFINEVYLTSDPHNERAYELKNVSTKDIFLLVQKFTKLFDNKNLSSFNTWCSRKKVNFLDANISRKRIKKDEEEHSYRFRKLYVLKEEIIEFVVKSLVEYVPKYKELVNKLKERYELIGYVRKSKNYCEENDRIRLLQTMVKRLKERHAVDRVYVSPYSNSTETISTRDMYDTSKVLMEKIDNTSGNTQDMLNYFGMSKNKICLIVIDFAGISTYCNDMMSLINDHENLEKLIIDQLPTKNKIKIIDREEIIKDPSILSEFECRMSPIQRSL
ncbi:unnamed protein product [Cunninghamella echinulata]